MLEGYIVAFLLGGLFGYGVLWLVMHKPTGDTWPEPLVEKPGKPGKPAKLGRTRIERASKDFRSIDFWTDEPPWKFREYGRVVEFGNGEYSLDVDARYNFDDVVQYIRSM